MHLRLCTTRSKNKTYRYVQFVQSIRRNGTTTQKVLANLGDLPDRTVDNLRLALRASREGRALVVAPDSPGLVDEPKVEANLRYLDLAVMLDQWRRWGLDEMMARLLPQSHAGSAADVVAALTVHRCVAPGSKLHAQRWLPTTAFPELLELLPEQFNNSRLHRVLDGLYEATPAVQQQLPGLYKEQGAAPSALFIDVTDTYFEGRGCHLAEGHRTKAGHRNKWAIGIVLLANDRGYPLRWEVISSKTKDRQAMGSLAKTLKEQDWPRDIPFVCDRAMGRSSSLRTLHGAGLRFLTAAPRNTIEGYTNALPHQAFSVLNLEETDDAYQQDIALVAQTARETTLHEVNEQMFVLDLGVIPLSQDQGKGQAARQGQRTAPAKPRKNGRGDIVASLRLALQLRKKLDSGEYKNQAALARALGLSRNRITQILNMLRLAPDIQQRLLDCGHEVHLSEKWLRPILQEQDHEKQHQLLGGVFDAVMAQHEQKKTEEPQPEPLPERLRLVAYFNPQVLVDKRRTARRHLDELNRFVKDLNDQLARADRGRAEEPTRRKIVRKLERYDYTDLFEVLLEPITVHTIRGRPVDSFRCELRLKPEAWRRRRRYDGFVLLLGSAELTQSAEDLAQLYRDKDLIEKDFQTIKSVIKLPPIYSYTDPKVQAHVTVCMLALLLCRSLEHQLKQANLALSTAACLETLATCHLNRLRQRPGGRLIYSVTEATRTQREILRALGLGDLTDDRAVAAALNP